MLVTDEGGSGEGGCGKKPLDSEDILKTEPSWFADSLDGARLNDLKLTLFSYFPWQLQVEMSVLFTVASDQVFDWRP